MGCCRQTDCRCLGLCLEVDLEEHLEDDLVVGLLDHQDHLEEDDFMVDHLGRLVLDLLYPCLEAFLPFTTCLEVDHLCPYWAAFLLYLDLDLGLHLCLLLALHSSSAYLPLPVTLMQPQALRLQQCWPKY